MIPENPGTNRKQQGEVIFFNTKYNRKQPKPPLLFRAFPGHRHGLPELKASHKNVC